MADITTRCAWLCSKLGAQPPWPTVERVTEAPPTAEDALLRVPSATSVPLNCTRRTTLALFAAGCGAEDRLNLED